MALDPNYLVTSDIEMYLVDKTTGEPLSGGYVHFYSMNDQITPKPVYTLTGTPGAPVYTELNNPCQLSSVGTFQDELNNNIVPYYYVLDDNGAPELYFIRVFDSGGVLQFTRSNWPNNVSSSNNSNSDVDQTNFIPNGQFLAHNNNYITETIVGVNTSHIAQGGWSMRVTNGYGGTYTSSFTRIPTGSASLNDFPRYALDFACTVADVAPVHDIAIQWNDVNEFEGGDPIGSQYYTLFCAAATNDGSTKNIDVRRIKYYGSGGSGITTTEDISVGTLSNVNSTLQYFAIPIQFGDNSTATLGTANDDYVMISLRPPVGTFNIRVTDFALVVGNQPNLDVFPPMTPAQMFANGVCGAMPTPAYDGSDLYLPLVLTPKGVKFDHSQVGQIVGKTQTSANAAYNELLMDGTVYVYANKNATTGIPYSRLGDYLLTNSPGGVIGSATINAGTIPMYGTGALFVTLFNVTAQPTHFYVGINTIASGGSATQVSASITIAAVVANSYYEATVVSVPSASDYWTFTAGSSLLVYNVWYEVNGVGTAPATPSGANIKVVLTASETTTTVATKTIAAVNKYQFVVLDARGYFWRGLDAGTSVDPNSATRTKPGISLNGSAFTGGVTGSLETAAFAAHTHTTASVTIGGVNGAATAPPWAAALGTSTAVQDNIPSGAVTLNNTGGAETRPINLALNWFIKY